MGRPPALGYAAKNQNRFADPAAQARFDALPKTWDERQEAYEEERIAYPPGSAVWVEGRAYVAEWGQENRSRLTRLRADLAYFGLSLVEGEFGQDRPDRAMRTFSRVDAEYAMNTIADFPGILFDDWAADLWGALSENPTTVAAKKAARTRATMNLSRFYREGKVAKRRNPSDGRLILFDLRDGKPPPDQRDLPADFAPPVPPTLKPEVRWDPTVNYNFAKD